MLVLQHSVFEIKDYKVKVMTFSFNSRVFTSIANTAGTLSNISVLSSLCVLQMSDISEEEWKTSLTSILEELDSQQYSKMLECLKKIPKGQKTTRSREKMPQKIIEHYGLEESINAIKDAMDQVPRRDGTVQDLLRPFLDKLRNKHEERSKGEFI